MELILLTCLEFYQLVSHINRSNMAPVIKRDVIEELFYFTNPKCEADINKLIKD